MHQHTVEHINNMFNIYQPGTPHRPYLLGILAKKDSTEAGDGPLRKVLKHHIGPMNA